MKFFVIFYVAVVIMGSVKGKNNVRFCIYRRGKHLFCHKTPQKVINNFVLYTDY